MVVMPVSAIVLLVAALNAAPPDRPAIAIGATASLVIGAWAHLRFWRRRRRRRR
jgi:hypothetical protein